MNKKKKRFLVVYDFYGKFREKMFYNHGIAIAFKDMVKGGICKIIN